MSPKNNVGHVLIIEPRFDLVRTQSKTRFITISNLNHYKNEIR